MTIICKHCGVELEKSMDKCPLCHLSPGEEATEQNFRANKSVMLIKQKMNLWLAFTVISFSTIAFTILINLIIDSSLNWSLYVAGSVFSAWAYYTIYTFFKHYIFMWVPLALSVTLGNLLLIDALSGGNFWFFKLGFPIASGAFILSGIFHFISRHVKYQGFNLLGYALLVIVALSLIIESSIGLYKTDEIHLWWSLFVAISATPISLILLFIHYRLGKGNDLKSFFHI
ncbi:MAG: DUF6320 domain-containing protein [Bacteroidales bacterium]|nr:DUF6320 domain-containing protein [Bacteroidales bacterium]